jgi:excisionase family DNA binding protein
VRCRGLLQPDAREGFVTSLKPTGRDAEDADSTGATSWGSPTRNETGRAKGPNGAISSERRLMNIEELARWFGTSPRHVRRLVQERRVPFVKIGHFIRFDSADILAWLELQKVSVHDDCREAGQPPWLRGLAQPVGDRAVQRAPRRRSTTTGKRMDREPPWLRARGG